VLDEIIFGLVCIDDLSSKALPITALRGLRAKGVEVCRKLEGLIVGGSKVLVELIVGRVVRGAPQPVGLMT
jgi:hypothetical protein